MASFTGSFNNAQKDAMGTGGQPSGSDRRTSRRESGFAHQPQSPSGNAQATGTPKQPPPPEIGSPKRSEINKSSRRRSTASISDIAAAHSRLPGASMADFWVNSFNIRALLPTKEAKHILGGRNARWEGGPNKKEEEFTGIRKYTKHLKRKHLRHDTAQTCNNLLTGLAVNAVSYALLQLSMESHCEEKIERLFVVVIKFLHLLSSIFYLCLAFPIHIGILKIDTQFAKKDETLMDDFKEALKCRGFWYDIIALGGFIAEIVHLPAQPKGPVPSLAQWFILLQLTKLWRVFQTTAASLASGSVQIFMLFLWLLFAAHTSACTLALMATLEVDVGQPTWADDILLDDSLHSCAVLYVAAFYFSTLTLTSIGYGDIVPANPWEQVLCVGIMLASQMFAAKVFADLNFITSTSNYWIAQHEARMTQTSAALASMRVPKTLSQRVLACQDFIDDVMKERRVQECFAGLSPPLDEELQVSVYHGLVTQASFLQAQPVEVIRLIIRSLTDRVYLPGDFVMRKGELGTELLFLRRGQVAVFIGDEQPTWEATEIAVLDTGSYFGEAALLTGKPRAAWILARTYCICSLLGKSALDVIIESYPGSLVILVRAMATSLKLKPTVTWKFMISRLALAFDTTTDCFDWFHSFVEDYSVGDDRILTWASFQESMRELTVSDLDMKMLWTDMDQDSNGFITLKEFKEIVQIEDHHAPEAEEAQVEPTSPLSAGTGEKNDEEEKAEKKRTSVTFEGNGSTIEGTGSSTCESNDDSNPRPSPRSGSASNSTFKPKSSLNLTRRKEVSEVPRRSEHRKLMRGSRKGGGSSLSMGTSEASVDALVDAVNDLQQLIQGHSTVLNSHWSKFEKCKSPQQDSDRQTLQPPATISIRPVGMA